MNKGSLKDKKDITHDELTSGNFEVVKDYGEDFDTLRKLLKYKTMGELCFYESKEVKDWSGGNDDQYRTYIPVSSEEESDEINKKNYVEIHDTTPRIIDYWFSNEKRRTEWIRGDSK